MKKYVFLLGILILACGNQSKQKTIEFWQFWTDPKAKPVIENVVAQFEKDNPQWKVNITDLTWTDGHQKIVVAFGAGNPPDLLELGSDWIAEFAAAGALSELPGDTSGLLMLSPGIWENKLFAWPWMLDTRAIYFNKSLLEKAGMSIPTDWGQLLMTCQKIQALGEDISGFGANSNEPHRLYKKFLPFVWSAGGDIMADNRINLDTPELQRALAFYQQLAHCGRVETQKNLEDAFCEGKIGFVISGGWLLKRLCDKPPAFSYELGHIVPEKRGGAALSFAGGEYLVIPQKSSNKDAAAKLLHSLTSLANSQSLCDSVGFGFPPYANQDITSPQKRILFDQLQNSRSTPQDRHWVYIEGIIETMIEEVTLGKSTPGQAIEKAQQKIGEIERN
jgi:ABC-type glycerol-3-phosphate transport system substrate-binding protein